MSESHLSIIYLFSLIIFADNYTKLCTIEADLSGAPILTQPKASGKGSFYTVKYDIILLFGTTELQAQLAWRENVSGTSYVVQSDGFRINFTCFLGNREKVSFKGIGS